MGKVTDMLVKIRAMTAQQLFDRHMHIVRAQAVREYIASKEDKDLTLEVRLTGEEIVRRMASSRGSFLPVTTKAGEAPKKKLKIKLN